MSPRTITLNSGETIEISVTMQDNSNFPYNGFFNHPPALSEINNNNWDAKDKVLLVLAHELGHNFGHHHASAFDYNIFETPLHRGAISSEDEYHDGYEVMADEWSTVLQ